MSPSTGNVDIPRPPGLRLPSTPKLTDDHTRPALAPVPVQKPDTLPATALEYSGTANPAKRRNHTRGLRSKTAELRRKEAQSLKQKENRQFSRRLVNALQARVNGEEQLQKVGPKSLQTRTKTHDLQPCGHTHVQSQSQQSRKNNTTKPAKNR